MIEIEEFPIPKPKLIIFEGCDKVGKSTLFQAVRRATNYSPLAVDRFTGSNYVYDKHYGRDNNLGMYLDAEEKIQEAFDCYLTLLTGDPNVIEKRIRQNEIGNDLEIAMKNFIPINNLFLDYFRKETRYKHKILINTTALSLAECVDIVLASIGGK